MTIFRVHYAASLDLRVELCRKKKRNKPCAFQRTSHTLCARLGIGNGCVLARKYLFQRIVWLPAPHQAGVFRVFQYIRLQMQIRNNEPLSPIVTRQHRIRQRICEGRKRNADSLHSLTRHKCGFYRAILTISSVRIFV